MLYDNVSIKSTILQNIWMIFCQKCTIKREQIILKCIILRIRFVTKFWYSSNLMTRFLLQILHLLYLTYTCKAMFLNSNNKKLYFYRDPIFFTREFTRFCVGHRSFKLVSNYRYFKIVWIAIFSNDWHQKHKKVTNNLLGLISDSLSLHKNGFNFQVIFSLYLEENRTWPVEQIISLQNYFFLSNPIPFNKNSFKSVVAMKNWPNLTI